MKLQEHRESLGLTVAQAIEDFARVRPDGEKVSEVCWRYWENGQKIPGRDNMKWLRLWSNNNVTPNDFYPLPCGSDCDSSPDPVSLAASGAAA